MYQPDNTYVSMLHTVHLTLHSRKQLKTLLSCAICNIVVHVHVYPIYYLYIYNPLHTLHYITYYVFKGFVRNCVRASSYECTLCLFFVVVVLCFVVSFCCIHPYSLCLFLPSRLSRLYLSQPLSTILNVNILMCSSQRLLILLSLFPQTFSNLLTYAHIH